MAATTFNCALRADGLGRIFLTGDINATAQLRDGGTRYLITGDILGQATIHGAGYIRLTGTISGLFSGALDVTISLRGDGSFPIGGTVGSDSLSATIAVYGDNRAVLAGNVISAVDPNLILHDSFNRPDGMPGTPDYCVAYDFTDTHTIGFQALTIVNNQLTFGYNIAGGSNYGALPIVAQSDARLEATVITPGVSSASNNKLLFFLRGGDLLAGGDVMGYILEYHTSGIKLFHYYLPDWNYDLVADSGVAAAPGDQIIFQVKTDNITLNRNGAEIINANGIGETSKILAGAMIVTDGLGTTPYAVLDELFVYKA